MVLMKAGSMNSSYLNVIIWIYVFHIKMVVLFTRVVKAEDVTVIYIFDFKIAWAGVITWITALAIFFIGVRGVIIEYF